jgi:Fungal tRNA ligase phosphodiesterase domain
LDDLETRLRAGLEQYRNVIVRMTTDISDTRESFGKSLVEKVKEVELITSYDAPSFVKIASIDVDVASVWEILKNLNNNGHLNNFFDRILQGKDWESIVSGLADEDYTEELGLVIKTHVTLAHYSEMSQSDMRSLYTPHLESSVELTTNLLLWNDRVMALAVTVSDLTNDGNVLPSSKNEFVHITVWYDKDVSAFEANKLPKLLAENKAFSVKFPDSTLTGTVSFWNM